MKKKILILCVFILFIFFITAIYINQEVDEKSQNFIYKTDDEISDCKTAIVLGALVFKNQKMSDIFQDRVDTALELYRADKVEKILISGDHGQVDYDEVNAAKDYLIEQGVEDEDIFTDHAGFDTYDTMYRARDIFQVESAIVVTQDFHLPRAVYIARELGLQAFGLSADKHIYMYATRNKYREYLANVKAWGNLLVNSKPKYLGEVIPISGDGHLSWD